ncbi:hypothetical protein BDQ17DRAFT_1273079 [Cyathus striatus]|nr:hypothetical protein BDQ17DRAFT_1273079 [Cyathus striatus]
MIRRSPTLIPMSDMDVQDIRDMVTNQKSNALGQQQLTTKMRRLAENPGMVKDDYDMLLHLNKTDKEKEKAQRLGLDA